MDSVLIAPTVSQTGEAPLEAEAASAVVVAAVEVRTAVTIAVLLHTIKVPLKAIRVVTIATSPRRLKTPSTVVISMGGCKASMGLHRTVVTTMKAMEIMKVRLRITLKV